MSHKQSPHKRMSVGSSFFHLRTSSVANFSTLQCTQANRFQHRISIQLPRKNLLRIFVVFSFFVGLKKVEHVFMSCKPFWVVKVWFRIYIGVFTLNFGWSFGHFERFMLALLRLISMDLISLFERCSRLYFGVLPPC